MMADDSAAAARESARILDDPRVRQFHDPARLSSRAFSALFGWGHNPAWDVYLFFDSEAVWKDSPPRPAEWTHQLAWADRARFRTGEELVRELRTVTGRMLGGKASGFRP